MWWTVSQLLKVNLPRSAHAVSSTDFKQDSTKEFHSDRGTASALDKKTERYIAKVIYYTSQHTVCPTKRDIEIQEI